MSTPIPRSGKERHPAGTDCRLGHGCTAISGLDRTKGGKVDTSTKATPDSDGPDKDWKNRRMQMDQTPTGRARCGCRVMEATNEAGDSASNPWATTSSDTRRKRFEATRATGIPLPKRCRPLRTHRVRDITPRGAKYDLDVSGDYYAAQPGRYYQPQNPCDEY